MVMVVEVVRGTVVDEVEVVGGMVVVVVVLLLLVPVVVVVAGGAVAVVVVVVVVVAGAGVGAGVKVHRADAQLPGVAGATTSTPGMVENDQTLMWVSPWRQTRVGALVWRELSVPRNCMVPKVAGAATGVRGTDTPLNTAVVT